MVYQQFSKYCQLVKFPMVLGSLVALVVGCGQQTGSNDQEIEFWTMQLQPKFTPYFNEINQKFEEDNPDSTITWVDIPWNAMESRILTAVSARNAPDVVNLNPDFASQLASRNAWLNLEEEIPTEVQGEYLPKIWLANQIEVCPTENNCINSTFGIPWYLTTTVTVYNRNYYNRRE